MPLESLMFFPYQEDHRIVDLEAEIQNEMDTILLP